MPNSNARRAAAPRILLLEDSTLDAELICEHLEQLQPPPTVRRAVNRAEYLSALDEMEFDVILADFSLPDFDGMAALELAQQRLPQTPFIFVSGVLGEEAAIESFRRGATDYILKQRLIRLPAAVRRALAEAYEKAERRRSEQHRELLVRELSHRVKNTMAMVMSIVRRTAKNSTNVDDYVDNLMGRLRAMADAHALLFETNWKAARLEDVIQRTVAAHIRRAERIELQPGPSILLDPKAALAVSMVINELATNAVKYGALSAEDGKVSVAWSLGHEAGQEAIHLEWHEHDGPKVQAPSVTGFGTTLIQRMIGYELLGEARLSYPEEGLVCEISFPLDNARRETGPLSADLSADRVKDIGH
ncbi:sensor histidine kinase [Rhizobium sp. SSA_523]|uniref:sensor histidine kinase n=1 Tax=Rhizobium sp. SSA_523 TaxID=2952477 RepID=UPI0020917E4B|nr:HWE histidine kinase domain-containing protein [Rhizobium sp. SSA_523]MCO5732249.1 response regulator [Rhizobium sp. SSA_523]WKC21341.1 HWE histidine kinase domain-containing protein [Rhizobium sp. SSA_523]